MIEDLLAIVNGLTKAVEKLDFTEDDKIYILEVVDRVIILITKLNKTGYLSLTQYMRCAELFFML